MWQSQALHPQSKSLSELLVATAGVKACKDVQRRDRILQAVLPYCALYGYRRCSMEDLAREAGVSRTALYHYFSNKEAVLVALCEWFHRDNLHYVEAKATGSAAVDLALIRLLESRMSAIDQLSQYGEYAFELVDENARRCGPIVLAANQHFIGLLERRLQDSEQRQQIMLTTSGLSARDAAEFLIDCCAGLLKHGAAGSQSVEQRHIAFRKRLTWLVHMAVVDWGAKPSFRPKA